jgi:hypothetical protein
VAGDPGDSELLIPTSINTRNERRENYVGKRARSFFDSLEDTLALDRPSLIQASVFSMIDTILCVLSDVAANESIVDLSVGSGRIIIGD